MNFGRLFLRTAIGGLLVGHGTQKLFGWFGGHGLDATAGMFGSLGMRPPKAHATAAALAEAGGGAALVLGAATPLASSALIATMVTAIRTVHGKNGPWSTNGGYEYNLVLIAAAVALTETGPGSPSVDDAIGAERRGAAWALIALALGIAGSYGASAVSSRFPEPPADASAETGATAEPEASTEDTATAGESASA
jgi:putative oxidoreductase